MQLPCASKSCDLALTALAKGINFEDYDRYKAVAEMMPFGFGEGHHFGDGLVTVVILEVAEVREGPDVRQIDLLHHRRQPVAMRRDAAMVFDDDVEAELRAEFAEATQPIGHALALFIGRAAGIGVHTNGMA